MTPAAEETSEGKGTPGPPARRRRRALQALSLVALAMILGFGLVGFAVRTDQGRGLVERALNGMSLGPVGRLRIEGLSGDVLDRFGVRTIEVVDDRGAWVRAHDVVIRWRPLALLVRHVHVFELRGREVDLLRWPHLAPRTPAPNARPLVSVQVDRGLFTLRSSEAFSVAEGAWAVDGGVRLRRSGALRAALTARSLRRAGDGAVLDVRYGDRDAFRLRAEVVEARGGAAAGALGLAPDQPLHLSATGAGAGEGGVAAGALVSGGRTLVDLKARWSRGVGEGRAHVVLDASRWTSYLAQRLGSAADIRLTTRPRPDHLLEAGLQVSAQGGRLSLLGPVDSRWRAREAALAVSVADLSKWTPAPKVGPASVSGTVSGGWLDFALKGRLEAHGVAEAGYQLDGASGPASVSLRAGEWRLGATLRGTGGHGATLAAGLLGPAPTITFDVSVLRDQRMLVRDLKVDGSAVRLTATGGETLLGGLEFSGGGDLHDLSRVRAGLGGSLSGQFTAREGKGEDRWSFTLKTDARGFATGVRDVDHFLGPSPKGAAAGTFAVAKGLDLERVEIIGAAASATGKGALASGGQISGAFDWRATGPFTAGPLEIAGAAVGDANLSGVLNAPRLDLKADLARIDAGALQVSPAHLLLTVLAADGAVTGAVSVTGAAGPYGPATAKASFQAARDEVVLSDAVVDAGGLRGAFNAVLRGGRVVRGDGTFLAGPGAFLDAGRLEGRARLTETSSGPVFQGALDGADVLARAPRVALASLHLRGTGPLSALPVEIAAAGAREDPFSFTGRGLMRAGGADLFASLQGSGQVRKAPFTLTGPAELRLGPGHASLVFAAAAAGGVIHADLHSAGEDFSGAVRAEGVEISPLTTDFVGRVSGRLDLAGRGSSLTGRLSSQVQGLRSRDEPEREGLSGTVSGSLAQDRLRLQADAVNVAGLKSHGEADLPAVATASPFRIAVDRTKPLTGAFSVEGEVRPLWDVLAGGERSLAGRIKATGAFAGTLNRPLATGTASLSEGRFRDIASGLQLQGLGVEAVFGQDGLTVEKFSGADGRGGSISGDGKVSFEEAGTSTFRLVLKKFQLLDNDIGRATASGSVLVTHPAKGEGRVSGALQVDRADIVAVAPTPNGVVPMDVIEVHQSARKGVEPVAVAAGTPIALDVVVRASRGVYLKGRGLNLELSLDSRVTGSIDHPAFDGVARVVSGNYDFAGKRFDVENSGTIHLGATAAQIRLDLSATWTDPTITAVVRVQGTAAKPEVTLTSSPILPQDEILARVLFGVSASQLAPAQGAEMASALASLAGGGGFDVIGNLRQFAGLDRLALGATQTAGTTISGGKYISKDIYLELTGGARNGTGAQVEWQIRKNLSVISRYGAALDPRYPNDTDASLSIRFRKDF